MRLATYRYGDGVGPGAVVEGHIVDLREVAASIRVLLEGGEEALEAAQAALKSGRREPLLLDRLLAPLPEPRLFIGVGLNYRDHAAETGREIGEHPTLFAKLPGAFAGPFEDIVCPEKVTTLDYEGELGFVLSRPCRNISPAEAPGFIGGYFPVNDLTVRAYSRPETLILAKSGKGFGPFGPWITTPDEVGDPGALRVRTWVNEELRQDSSTAQMYRSCSALLSYLSEAISLEPGDLITTGSPAGSGVGRTPPSYLRPGDKVRVEIDRLGAIENRIVSGGSAAARAPSNNPD
jgi:2-keto-4-pentenoate hydratase/2-oxohepta-3-ene-1,7-dioic acid hydratase in catechol pathway